MAKGPKHGLFLAAALGLLGCACSFDYSAAVLDDELRDDTPNSSMVDFDHSIVENDKVIFRVMAAKAELFEAKKEILLRDAYFIEYDQTSSEPITVGQAKRVRFYTESQNAELSDYLYFYSKRNEASLESGYLFWDNDKKTLEARRDKLVTIKKDDGSNIRGEGFAADLRTRSFSFYGRTDALIVTTEEEDEEAQE